MKVNRRSILKLSSWGAAIGIIPSKIFSAKATPSDAEGPFYPSYFQKDKDFDLTRVEGKAGTAKGQVIYIEGRVIDTNGQPIENVTVDLWQANAVGRYRHPHDDNTAPLDPNFQGWAIVPSGKNGSFKFKTIFPGAYGIGPNNKRPPHIHFKISKKGYQELTTQMYFPNEPLNEKDFLFNRKSKSEQALMVAKSIEGKKHHYAYEIVLSKA